MHNVSVDISQSKVSSLMSEGQLLVVDAKQVQARGVPVMNVNRVFKDAKSEFVGRTVR